MTLKKPQDKGFELEATIAFPTDHMGRIIEAARAQKTILEFPVFDGSETGEKVYNTLTVIGQEIAPNARLPTDAAAGQQALAGMKRWPVTVSYFDKAAKTTGEQAPDVFGRRGLPANSLGSGDRGFDDRRVAARGLQR